MKKALNGIWRCTLPDGTKIPAQVPGCFDIGAPAWDIGGVVGYETDFE